MAYPITDPDAEFAEPFTALPAYNTPTAEPTFGTTIRRVSDDDGDAMANSSPAINWGDITGHDYFKKQNTWNADDSRLLLIHNKSGGTDREAIVLNASTYVVEKTVAIDGNWDVRWHPTDPDVLLYVQYQSGCEIGEFDITTETPTTLYSFPEYDFMYLGPWEGNFSDDGRYVALQCQKPTSAWETIVVDMNSGTKIGVAALGNWHETDDGAVMMSKLGNYVVVNTSNTDNKVYNKNMTFLASMPGSWTHGDIGIDGSGSECYVAADGNTGRVHRYRFSDGNVLDLTTSGFAENVSCRSGINGWVWVSYPGRHLDTNWPPYVDEVLRVAMDGSRTMVRLAHLHASYVSEASQDYYAEPHPIPSRDGSKLAFRSLWEGTFGSDPVHAFVVIEEEAPTEEEGGGGGEEEGGGEPEVPDPPVSTAPTPAVPSGSESEIYRGQDLQFQVKAYVRLDFPTFSGNVFDGFDGIELNPDYWHKFSPSWGLLNVAGGEVEFGSSSPGISESYFVTKPSIWFPKRTDTDWTLQFRIQATAFNGFGTFIDLCSLQQYRAIMRLAADATGYSGYMPNGTKVLTLDGDTSYNTFKVTYTAASKQYEFFIDYENGGGFQSLATMSAVNNRADFLVFGNSGVRQGELADWTTFKVDYVSMIGTEEGFDVPEWASPQYLYDQLQYDNELWSELPSVISGRIDSHKSNEADTLELDLINFTILDKADPTTRLYTHFSFMNRFIKILSRVNDGFEWTPWRQIFLGSCDEKNIEIRDTGETVLTLRARDWVRKRLAETRVIRAYSDYGDVVEGLYMNMNCAQIMQDLAQNVCGLPFTAINVPNTPYNTPRTLNIAGDPASQVFTNLMQGLGFTWWCNHATGQIFVQPLPMGTGVPQYWLSTDGEVETIQWNQSSLEHTAAIEFGISNTEFQNGGFSLAYPVTPIPFFGRVELVDAVVAQSDAALGLAEIPQRVYMQSIRELGSVRVNTSCQDWLEHNIEIGLIDNSYLGIKPEDGPWLIDGWTHEWEGSTSFRQEILLVNQHPDRVVREALSEHVAGIP